MKLSRRSKVVLLCGGAVALAYYATVLAPQRHFAQEMAELHALGVPKSLLEADFTKAERKQNSAPQFEKLFHEWVHEGVRDKHSASLRNISLASTTAELEAARKSLRAMRPFLRRFEQALESPSLFEKDWSGSPDEIAFPELTHFKTFSDLYESAAYLALFDDDKDLALTWIRFIDRVGDHCDATPFMIHRILAGRSRKQASALIEFAATKWQHDGPALEKLNEYARSRSFLQDLSEHLGIECLLEIDSLDRTGNYRFEELSYGPQEGWPKRKFRQLALSETVRRGAKAKLAVAWNRLIHADREGGGKLQAVEDEYRSVRRDLSSELWLTGRLANHAIVNLDQVINSVRTAEDSRKQALRATEQALNAATGPRSEATRRLP